MSQYQGRLEHDGSEHDFFCFEKGALGSVLQLLPWSPGTPGTPVCRTLRWVVLDGLSSGGTSCFPVTLSCLLSCNGDKTIDTAKAVFR